MNIEWNPAECHYWQFIQHQHEHVCKEIFPARQASSSLIFKWEIILIFGWNFRLSDMTSSNPASSSASALSNLSLLR